MVNNTLIVQRWTTDQQLICLLNFSDKDQQLAIPDGINQWQKLFDSADPKWNGPVSSPEILSVGLITMQPASILIYTQYHA